ncbi:hypothetical protein BGX38DRAFT_1244509 [Terfezia claveryi]|nr:hypothetical protein BGX38DRAFT_1244509 [Terfezia claveryi]
MGRTHTSNSDQTTPGPISITEKRYHRPPWPDSNSSITMGARLTPDIDSETEHEMDGELELPRSLDNAETTTRGCRPYGTGGASGINEVFARRREEMSYLTEKVQNMRPRACRHPQPRMRRGFRARDQDDEVGVANKHARESGDEPNARRRTLKEAFAVAIGGGIVLLSPILVGIIGFICVMKLTIFISKLCILGGSQICNHFWGGIEIILEMLNLEVLQGGMMAFMEEATVSINEKQKKEAREQLCKRPVTSRAVSKLRMWMGGLQVKKSFLTNKL